MADNPVVVTCTADTWVLAAEDVTTGTIHTLSSRPAKYLHTFRLTGEAAPTTQAGAVAFSGSLPISSDQAIDVYIMAIRNAGSVRADL